MIKADAMRDYFHVKEADVADQRLSSLVFTPGADDFHTNLLEQSRCRLDSIKITQNRGVSSLLGDSFRSRCRQATAPTTCVQARRLDSPHQTQRSKRHTVWTSLNRAAVNLTRPTPCGPLLPGPPTDCFAIAFPGRASAQSHPPTLARRDAPLPNLTRPTRRAGTRLCPGQGHGRAENNRFQAALKVGPLSRGLNVKVRFRLVFWPCHLLE